MRKLIGVAALLVLLTYYTGAWKVFAAADPGYTKVGSVAFGTNTFTDSTVTDGATYNYEVTAANAAGESGPSNVITLTIPAAGAHTTTENWTPGSGGGVPVAYNVYRATVSIPNQPAALTGTVN